MTVGNLVCVIVGMAWSGQISNRNWGKPSQAKGVGGGQHSHATWKRGPVYPVSEAETYPLDLLQDVRYLAPPGMSALTLVSYRMSGCIEAPEMRVLTWSSHKMWLSRVS
jgi:hypothetical protein